jgi:Protein of unknown function (DUF4232)
MTSGLGLGAAALVCAVAVATSSATGVAATGAPFCRGGALRITVVRSALVAAGNIGGYIGFTNRSRHVCRLSGWPTVVAITAAGTSTTARHVRATMFGPYRVRGVPVVVLRPGRRADAVYAGSDIPGDGRASCPPAYRRLRVTPPRSSRATLVAARQPSCSGVIVTMVVRPSTLYHG